MLIYFIIRKIFQYQQEKKYKETTTVFKLKYSNVKFVNNLNKILSINLNEIVFENEEYNTENPVNQETKTLLCIANYSKTKINCK